jgi:hypothetical protein
VSGDSEHNSNEDDPRTDYWHAQVL